MLGTFSYSNPTKLYFGENSLEYLNEELPKFGSRVLLVYGSGSIKKNGIYEKVRKTAKPSSKTRALCRTQPSRSCMKAVGARGTQEPTLSSPSAAVLFATMQKRCLSPRTARKTHGINITCAWRTWTTKSSLSAAY